MFKYITFNILCAAGRSNLLIDYFQLETKYPKIAKYIRLRRKFQNYYMFINILLIIFVCITILLLNLVLLLEI